MKGSGMSESHQDLVYHQSLANAGAEMANLEINILSITNEYVFYEFSYIAKEAKIKKWAKRLTPLSTPHQTVLSIYLTIIGSVKAEREALGQ